MPLSLYPKISTPFYFSRNLLQITVFLVLFLPLSIFCAEIAGIRYINLAMAHLLYLIIAGVVIILKRGEVGRGSLNLMRFYYLIILGLSIGGALLYYLGLELFNQKMTNLLYLNPFWLVWRILY